MAALSSLHMSLTSKTRWPQRGIYSLLALTFSGLLCPGLPAHAGLFSDDAARKVLIQLREQLQELRESTQEQVEKLSDALAETSARMDRLETAQEQERLLSQRLDRIDQELADFRGQIEMQAHILEATSERIHQLPPKLPSPPHIPTDQVSIDRPQTEVASTETEPELPLTAPSVKEKKAFDEALAHFRAGKFQKAQALFQRFRADYPDSIHRPEAQYWLGNTLFALRNYPAAISAQTAFTTTYPDHPYVPDALLNLSYAQIELDQQAAGRKTLESIVKRFPHSQAAQRAKQLLSGAK